MGVVNQFRRCSRPGCGKPAVATLTYAYAQSTAVVGPLASNHDPHAWDLCEFHAGRITAPLGWELVRVESDEEEDLTALAEAVREAGQPSTGLVDAEEEPGAHHPVYRQTRAQARRAHLSVVPEVGD